MDNRNNTILREHVTLILLRRDLQDLQYEDRWSMMSPLYDRTKVKGMLARIDELSYVLQRSADDHGLVVKHANPARDGQLTIETPDGNWLVGIHSGDDMTGWVEHYGGDYADLWFEECYDESGRLSLCDHSGPTVLSPVPLAMLEAVRCRIDDAICSLS